MPLGSTWSTVLYVPYILYRKVCLPRDIGDQEVTVMPKTGSLVLHVLFDCLMGMLQRSRGRLAE